MVCKCHIRFKTNILLSTVLRFDDADGLFELTTTIRNTGRIRKQAELPSTCNGTLG